jgi:F-type H+-transporting ATPase subunit b
MRRLVWIVVLSAAGVFSQEHGAAEHKAPEHGAAAHGAEEHKSSGPAEVSIWWKWANFAILAGGLGYMVAKNAPAYFASRNEEIRKGLEEGAELQREANARTSAMEQRLRNLDAEIAELKTKAKADIAAESERIQAETAIAMAKIQAHAEAEIASAAKNERAQLKTYAADLALKIAEDKLRGQLTSQVDAGLMQGFLKGLN